MSYSIAEFEHIYTGNIDRCMRLAISLLGNEDDARDAVQDVFLKLWESDIEVVNPESFIFRSVRNACLDRIKAVGIRDRIRQGLTVEPIASDEDIGQRHEAILEAIEHLLTDRQKQVIDKVYDEGLSYKAAAESLDVSVATVNKSLVSAMKTLRNHFKTDKQ